MLIRPCAGELKLMIDRIYIACIRLPGHHLFDYLLKFRGLSSCIILLTNNKSTLENAAIFVIFSRLLAK